ncbi:MAG: MFS transporter [Terriglobia bacterium]|jgi:MFS family permease|nr:MFS transporter [Terriglobia bacterium]
MEASEISEPASQGDVRNYPQSGMSDVSASQSRIAFHYPNFRYYQAARFLAITASEMQSVAVGWQVYEITRRPLDLGLVGLAQFLPGILLFLLAGHTADRIRRQHIIATCYVGFATCSLLLLAFTVHGRRSVEPIYVILVLIGVVRAFNGPAGQAFLPMLVPEEHFPNAVAWGSSIFMSATIFGPTVGGILYGWTGGPNVVYGTAAVALGIAFIFVAMIRIQPAQRPRKSASADTVMAGFRYVIENKLVLGAISLDLFAVLLGGAVALLPVYAKEILFVGPWGLGLLRAAPGVGAVITAIAVAHWPLRKRAGTTMLWCVAGFGAFTVIFGLSRNVVVSLLALVLVGATDMISVVVRSTMVQLATPDEMRGRVSAVNMIFVGASNEFGQFESGVTANWFGTVPAVVLGGIGTLVVVALWSALFPELRRVNELTPGLRKVIPQEPAVTADPND